MSVLDFYNVPYFGVPNALTGHVNISVIKPVDFHSVTYPSTPSIYTSLHHPSTRDTYLHVTTSAVVSHSFVVNHQPSLEHRCLSCLMYLYDLVKGPGGASSLSAGLMINQVTLKNTKGSKANKGPMTQSSFLASI